jgi:hypothetical protein
MAKQESLQDFVKNLDKFPLLIQKSVVRDWQNMTDNVFAESQEKVPIHSGALLLSGQVVNARITKNGIESSIIYALPYARDIESGKREDGTDITLVDVGVKYNNFTKTRKGQFAYLSTSIESYEDIVINDIKKSIGLAWDKI